MHKTNLVHQSGPIVIALNGVMANLNEDGKDAFLQDQGIISSARVSTGSEKKKEGGEGLVGALYRDRHETPFEGGSMFRFFVECPISVAQPFFQLPYVHNEFSGRYSVIDGEFYTPEWAKENPEILKIFNEAETDSREIYKSFLDMGIAKEQARLALLFRFNTKFYWTVSLRHLLELMSLENHENAPDEFWRARDEIIPTIIKEFSPIAYAKMEEYKRFIPTAWHKEIIRHPGKFYENEICKDYERYACIDNIGDVYLLEHSKFNPEFFRLAVQTKVNPTRGFAHAKMTFFIKEPIFVHRQWVRHRYGAWTEIPPNFDVITTDKDFYMPEYFRIQVGKSMSYIYEDAPEETNLRAQLMLQELINRSCERYWILRKKFGISPGNAAQNLPYTFRIHSIWTANLESLMNYFSLRCDTHAQWETRRFAEEIYKWFKQLYPIPHDIFIKHLNFGKNEDLFEK